MEGPHILTILFAISHIFSVNEQYFSLTINQLTVLSDMAYQPSEQDSLHLLHMIPFIGHQIK